MEGSIIAAVTSAILFGIAAALNATAVATAYWVSATATEFGVTGAKFNIGLWRFCTSGLGTSTCLDISDPSNIGYSDDTAFIHTARALSIAAAGLCLFSIPLALIGYAARNGLAVGIAALVAFLQAASLAAALLFFFIKLFVEIRNATNGSPTEVEVEVLPGWSFYIGGVGVILYGIGGLVFVFTGIAMLTGSGHTHVRQNEGMNYSPLDEMPPKQL